ncbi:uncharacterized protein LOC119688979 [Teleopsis dalmanni]|uniref:uncharacterized protein LOC119688979 n=1 Tax=Teleopsis dalmanni TaxID=139649 RepID=UPI0018CE1DB5|nr:uncharacterized protein LOC119688979 [Teleopsis dalmanni]
MDFRRFSAGGGDVDCMNLQEQSFVNYYNLPFVGDSYARYLYPSLTQSYQRRFEEDVRRAHERLRRIMHIPDTAFMPHLEDAINMRSFTPKVFTSEYSRLHRTSLLQFQQRLDIVIQQCYQDKCLELNDEIRSKTKVLYILAITMAIGLGCVLWCGYTKIRRLML